MTIEAISHRYDDALITYVAADGSTYRIRPQGIPEPARVHDPRTGRSYSFVQEFWLNGADHQVTAYVDGSAARLRADQMSRIQPYLTRIYLYRLFDQLEEGSLANIELTGSDLEAIEPASISADYPKLCPFLEVKDDRQWRCAAGRFDTAPRICEGCGMPELGACHHMEPHIGLHRYDQRPGIVKADVVALACRIHADVGSFKHCEACTAGAPSSTHPRSGYRVASRSRRDTEPKSVGATIQMTIKKAVFGDDRSVTLDGGAPRAVISTGEGSPQIRETTRQSLAPPDAKLANLGPSSLDIVCMGLAIEEARRSCDEHDGSTHPRVGAVVVRDGRILAQAHRGEGERGQHAEYVALERKLGEQTLTGSTVYTTLEPCTARNHPKVPCAHRLAERQVSRVYIGMLDPNPAIQGKGEALLRRVGIDVQRFPHDLARTVEELNRDFVRSHASAATNTCDDTP